MLSGRKRLTFKIRPAWLFERYLIVLKKYHCLTRQGMQCVITWGYSSKTCNYNLRRSKALICIIIWKPSCSPLEGYNKQWSTPSKIYRKNLKISEINIVSKRLVTNSSNYMPFPFKKFERKRLRLKVSLTAVNFPFFLEATTQFYRVIFKVNPIWK